MKTKKFEEFVEEALSEIPEKFKEHLQNLTVIIEDRPSQEMSRKLGGSPFSSVLGLYHGVPFKHRGPFYGNLPPDVIVIYREPIERICRSEGEIKEKVKDVVIHEIAHYFGFKDDELRKIEEQGQDE